MVDTLHTTLTIRVGPTVKQLLQPIHIHINFVRVFDKVSEIDTCTCENKCCVKKPNAVYTNACQKTYKVYHALFTVIFKYFGGTILLSADKISTQSADKISEGRISKIYLARQKKSLGQNTRQLYKIWDKTFQTKLPICRFPLKSARAMAERSSKVRLRESGD